MTEEESKTKWCPFSRCFDKGFRDGIAGYNRCEDGATPVLTGAQCQGSACMAWRDTWGPFNATTGKLLEWGDARNSTDVITQRKTGGFCGLAGKP